MRCQFLTVFYDADAVARRPRQPQSAFQGSRQERTAAGWVRPTAANPPDGGHRRRCGEPEGSDCNRRPRRFRHADQYSHPQRQCGSHGVRTCCAVKKMVVNMTGRRFADRRWAGRCFDQFDRRRPGEKAPQTRLARPNDGLRRDAHRLMLNPPDRNQKANRTRGSEAGLSKLLTLFGRNPRPAQAHACSEPGARLPPSDDRAPLAAPRQSPAAPPASSRASPGPRHLPGGAWGGEELRQAARWCSGVSLYVRRGEAVGLLGPNGAGKTTVFYMITGLVKPDKGTIELDGHDVTAPADVPARAGSASAICRRRPRSFAA